MTDCGSTHAECAGRVRPPLPMWLRGSVVFGTLAALLWLEFRHPLRRRHIESKAQRDGRNLAIAGMSAATIRLCEEPITAPLSRAVEQHRIGLVQQLPIRSWARDLLAIVLLDYTLYVWHFLTHRVPLLWRFHKPHHVDLEMDASTALRFHLGEMMLSVPWRAMQILAIGAGPRALSIWQTAVLVEILFHHSNLDISETADRRLSWLFVTPRMHGIHHSDDPAEMSSNWSNLLSIWDRIHGTFRDDPPQDSLRIGVRGYDRPKQVTLGRVLAMPLHWKPTDDQYLGRPAQARSCLPHTLNA